MIESSTLPIYKRWLETATQEQIAHVDRIYLEAEKHYSEGGDTIVETCEPSEVLEQFKTVEEARAFCNLHTEQATNCRWGEDSDPELKRKEWK